MTRPHTIGSMFSGYGGLCHLAAVPMLGMDVAWHCETDPAALKVLDVRAPGVPNLSDVTAVDWTMVPPVEVITAGFPCQDLSYAGKGAGIKEGTRSGLWTHVVAAVCHLGPRLVLLENVSAIVARRPGLDVVLDDLARLGYDARWTTLRASDVGAPHQRNRWWCVAYPADSDIIGQPSPCAPGPLRGGPSDHHQPAPQRLLPTPRATDGTKGGPNQRGSSGDLMLPSAVMDLLPTPTSVHAPYNNRGEPQLGRVWDLLPTPQAQDAKGHTPDNAANRAAQGRQVHLGHAICEDTWGDYADPIARWEALTRPAPDPTTPGKTGKPRLSPVFVEWLMGLPDGWVTDVPGVSRAQALKALGNGVVPAQAAAAYTALLNLDVTAVAA